jgi:hypothetical protein
VAIPKEVLTLVERFKEQYDSYKSPAYNETQLRREFVDPFFKALGWDVDNEQGFAEAYKDVIHEDSIKIGGATKAPDYSFRIGGTRKFFVETKKPYINIKKDTSPAFQLRRYGWSAKLPLSVLTDFEEFAVYDCRIRPAKDDAASNARTIYMRFDEYEDRWDEIEEIFSRQSILKGAFDKYTESTKKKRGTAEVDEAFLSEIELWRADLARDIAKRNKSLNRREINSAVQKTIDRIVFLRICEDRGIENYGQLQSVTNGKKVYARLGELFRKADDRYNSGLFHFTNEKARDEADEWTLSLSIDDTVLRKIIRALYYPESPYEFSVLSADILGQVYEQFLGKTIRLTKSHQVKIEEKPEVKKAGGVFYTPEYVVEYIVNRTIGPLVEGKHAHEVAGRTKTTWKPSKTGRALTVLDPACGSGSFLIGSYQFLLDWYLNHYIETGPKKFKDRVFQTKKEEWRLTTAERKRILLDHIFGVDIDSQAVEVTKLSLLLKVLEGENRENLERQLRLFRDRALPDLSSNIKCGNSLIGSDFYSGVQMDLFDSEEMLQINAFDWAGKHGFKKFMEVGGFDCIVGNPPYDVLEKDRGKSSWPHSALRGYIDGRSEFSNALGGKLNLFRFFVVRSLQLTRVGGRFGNIIPLSILADISCANTRRHVMLSSDDIRCDCFPQKDNPNRRVFKNAKLSTLVLTCCRRKEVKPSAAKLEIRVFPWNSFDDACKTAAIKLSETKLIDKKNTPIPLVDAIDWNLCRKIHKQSNVMRLGDVPDFNVTRGEINQTVFREYITSDSRRSRLLKGVEVGQFVVHDKLSQGEREWFNEHEYLKSKPPRDLVAQRRIATQRITGVDEL